MDLFIFLISVCFAPLLSATVISELTQCPLPHLQSPYDPTLAYNRKLNHVTPNYAIHPRSDAIVAMIKDNINDPGATSTLKKKVGLSISEGTPPMYYSQETDDFYTVYENSDLFARFKVPASTCLDPNNNNVYSCADSSNFGSHDWALIIWNENEENKGTWFQDGYYIDGTAIGSAIASATPELCSIECDNNDLCDGFNWDNTMSTKCLLYKDITDLRNWNSGMDGMAGVKYGKFTELRCYESRVEHSNKKVICSGVGLFHYNNDGEELNLDIPATDGGLPNPKSLSQPMYGAGTGNGLSWAGVIRKTDVESGIIPHALRVTFSGCDQLPEYMTPAIKTDQPKDCSRSSSDCQCAATSGYACCDDATCVSKCCACSTDGVLNTCDSDTCSSNGACDRDTCAKRLCLSGDCAVCEASTCVDSVCVNACTNTPRASTCSGAAQCTSYKPEKDECRTGPCLPASAVKMGMRLFLPLSVDCDTRTVPKLRYNSAWVDPPPQQHKDFLKMVCRALQNYGLIISDGAGDRTFAIQAERDLSANWADSTLLGLRDDNTDWAYIIRPDYTPFDGDRNRDSNSGIPFHLMKVLADSDVGDVSTLCTACTTVDDCDTSNYCATGTVTCVIQSGQTIGTCTKAGPPTCSDNVDCTVDTCENSTCIHTTNDVSCSDGKDCNGQETCHLTNGCQDAAAQMECGSGQVCSQILDACVSATACNAECTNNLCCDGTETCNTNGVCQNGTPVPCTADALLCTDDECDPTTCLCAHPAKVCPTDAHACTTNACDTSNGNCVITTDDSACSNGLACDGTETCHSTNGCQDGTAPTCPTGKRCNEISSGYECEDDPCYLVTCSALDECHLVGTCDADTGVCSNPQTSDNIGCSTGTCQSGVCQASSSNACPTGTCAGADTCHYPGICTSGTCNYPMRADGTTCSGGTCQCGVCVATPTCTGVTCTAMDNCHSVGTCTDGICSDPLKTDGAACTINGDAGTCSVGICFKSGCDSSACTNDKMGCLADGTCGCVGDSSCCSSTSPCTDGQGDCDTDADCIGDRKCYSHMCPINPKTPDFSTSGDGCCFFEDDIICDGRLSSCCNTAHRCGEGEGDCDNDGECKDGYICGVDNCPWNSSDDCCVEKVCHRCDGKDGLCCSSSEPCGADEGDCDDHAAGTDCEDGFRCARDNCSGGRFQSGDDCCVYTDDFLCLDHDFGDCCSSTYPCGAGEGDCNDQDYGSDCESGLRCGRDNCPLGENSDFQSGDDCCVSIADYECDDGVWNECCTSTYPCGVGEGHCHYSSTTDDDDARCEGSLVCGENNCGSPFVSWQDCCKTA